MAAQRPRIIEGDLLDATLGLVADAPAEMTKVVFHSAVLAYVDAPDRLDFAEAMGDAVRERDDLVWLANEGAAVVPILAVPDELQRLSPGPAPFQLSRNGSELLALTDPHGAWVRWNTAASLVDDPDMNQRRADPRR